MRKTAMRWLGLFAFSLAFFVTDGATRLWAATESGIEAPWYTALTFGMLDMEGDEEFDDAFQLSGILGYDLNERWGVEGVLCLAPRLNSRLPGIDDATAFGIALDGIFHITRWKRVDPFIAVGVGFMGYTEELRNGNQSETQYRLGGGLMYHFNDVWAVRADYRAMLAGFGNNPDANSVFGAGVIYTWGAATPPRLVATGGPVDSDGDGLTDAEEAELGTDPYDPDTDKDELTDGQEVKTYRTDPLNPDTDYDGLKDGAEVLKHQTNPLDRDTDKGGVADGHEVIEDGTNPLDPADDLVLFELYLQFDYDKAVIKPQYYPQLDVIAKVLRRHPEAAARVEGHADKLQRSRESYNQKLSQRRAEAVVNYFADKGQIARDRMTPVGYGFSRPKDKNDPKLGNPANRRVEVYLKGVARDAAATLPEEAPIVPPSDVPAADK